MIADASSFRASDCSGDRRCGAIRIPQHLLRPRLAAPDGARALHLPRGGVLTVRICGYGRNVIAGACGADFDGLAPAAEAPVVNHLYALLSLAIGAKAEGHEAARTGLARRWRA